MVAAAEHQNGQTKLYERPKSVVSDHRNREHAGLECNDFVLRSNVPRKTAP